MKNKATEIVNEIKSRGKEVLSKVTEFWGVKQKLENIRDKIRGGISETNETLARIEGFAEGMTASNDMFVNSFRMLMGKERKNYKDNMFVKIDSCAETFAGETSCRKSIVCNYHRWIRKFQYRVQLQ
ncbi:MULTISPECIES: DUF6674 family protein [unclassified Coprococcus]|uniref:DUF6674 family protein n=1 Tax=unclassified Coprococcus TaxID=2684943 RepID=UPI0018658F92|nr:MULTISPECIES: DUF6674 family protein [unclassified Coprococcus]